jgi:hypothetical protein
MMLLETRHGTDMCRGEEGLESYRAGYIRFLVKMGIDGMQCEKVLSR